MLTDSPCSQHQQWCLCWSYKIFKLTPVLEYDDGANSPICQLRIPRKLRRDDKIGYETLPAYTRHGYRYQHTDIVMSDIRKLFTLKTSTINFPIHH